MALVHYKSMNPGGTKLGGQLHPRDCPAGGGLRAAPDTIMMTQIDDLRATAARRRTFSERGLEAGHGLPSDGGRASGSAPRPSSLDGPAPPVLILVAPVEGGGAVQRNDVGHEVPQQVKLWFDPEHVAVQLGKPGPSGVQLVDMPAGQVPRPRELADHAGQSPQGIRGTPEHVPPQAPVDSVHAVGLLGPEVDEAAALGSLGPEP